MAKTKFTGTSDKFKSAHKNKSVSEVIEYFSNPNAYSGIEDIISLLEDIGEFSFANADSASKSEKEKLIKLYNIIRDSKKQNKKAIETISLNSAEIKKAIKEEVTTQAPQKIQKKIPIQPTGTKYTVAPKKPTFVVAKSSNGVLDKVIEKVSATKESDSKITPVKKSEKTTKPKSTKKVEATHRVVRTKEQVHQEKMYKAETDRLKEENKKIRNTIDLEKVLTEKDKLNFIKTKQFDENVRHRIEREYTERLWADVRDKEAINKDNTLKEKAKHRESIEKISKGRISLARMKTKRQYDFMESDVGSAFYKDQNKTARSKQTAMNKRAKVSLERAQLALENTKARNAIKEKQLEDRRMRDILRENSRREKERNSKTSAKHKAIFEGIKESSPSLAYAYLGAQKIMQNRYATPEKKEQESGGSFMQGALAGGALLGSGALAGGALARGKLGLVGKSLAYGKHMISSLGAGGKATNPSNVKYLTGLASNGASASVSAGAKVPMAQRMGQALNAGKGAGKLFGKTPLIGGAISGALEYNDSGSAGRALAVGAGSMAGATAGAALGAAAGSFIPGAGTVVGGLLGGIVGATLGESGMKALTQKFLGKTQKQLNRESQYKGVNLSGTSFGDGTHKRVVPSDYGKQADVPPLAPTTTTGNVKKISSGLPSKKPKNIDTYHSKAYYALLDEAIKAGVKNPEIVARLGAAQSVEETGHGKHAPGNNYFGVKGEGTTQTTKEFVNGKFVTIKDNFVKYDSLQDSARGYIDFLKTNKRYSGVLNAESIDEAISLQGNSGYATNPNYEKNIRSIDRTNTKKLLMAQNQLDAQTIATKSTPAPVNVVSGGSSNVNNVQNTTVINQQDTDPTIRQHQYALLRVGSVL